MIKRLSCLLALGTIVACNNKVENVIGRNYTGHALTSRTKLPTVPGMKYIPSGSYVIGATSSPNVFKQFSQNKRVSVASFYMDEKEVTNNQYREFVNWVRDSVAVTQYMDKSDPYYLKTSATNGEKPADKQLNWRILGKDKRIWSKTGLKNNPRLDQMFYQYDQVLNRKGELNTKFLNYTYEVFDYNEAFKNRNNLTKTRKDYTYIDTVNVYPDTSVWMSDFNNANNKLLVKNYFSNPAMGEYPVVGVTWRQARAYAAWKTMYINKLNNRNKLVRQQVEIRLPTEAEFEYAARGGLVDREYPWGDDLRNNCNCLMANFRSAPGNYLADGGLYTTPSKSFYQNGYGLFNMAGNVAEWTINLYTTSKLGLSSDLNPMLDYTTKPFDSPEMRRRVVKGGSWKDAPFFIRNAARSYEDQEVARSYIGFRTVMSASLEQSIYR